MGCNLENFYPFSCWNLVEISVCHIVSKLSDPKRKGSLLLTGYIIGWITFLCFLLSTLRSSQSSFLTMVPQAGVFLQLTFLQALEEVPLERHLPHTIGYGAQNATQEVGTFALRQSWDCSVPGWWSKLYRLPKALKGQIWHSENWAA